MLIDSEISATASYHPEQGKILFIQRIETASLYTDDLLRFAGFTVKAVTPAEVPAIANDGIAAYSVFMLSSTLMREDIPEIATRLRQSNPRAKIILMEGSDLPNADGSLYDATFDGLDGPKALISAVRRWASGLP